jgi:hypothetical protein
MGYVEVGATNSIVLILDLEKAGSINPKGCKTALTCSRSRLMQFVASTGRSLNQRTSMFQFNEPVSVFTRAGPIAASQQNLQLTHCRLSPERLGCIASDIQRRDWSSTTATAL